MPARLGPDLRLIMLGAGGHAKVLLSLVEALGLSIQGICDPALALHGLTNWRGVPVLGGDEVLSHIDPGSVGLINGIGQTEGKTVRQRLYEKLRTSGFHFPTLVHPLAWVSTEARIELGTQIMAGAVVQTDCYIGENCIINTNSSIDHDTIIGAHVHVAPGVTLCGSVKVGDGAFIACGATVIQNVCIGEMAFVGAGVTLVHDLAARQLVRSMNTSQVKLHRDDY